jgi:hypothetical protein
MTTERAVATNATALRNLADRLERMGYAGGDAYTEAEHIALNLLADGYRLIEKPPPLQGSTSTEAARRAAIEAAAEAVRSARERRTGAGR